MKKIVLCGALCVALGMSGAPLVVEAAMSKSNQDGQLIPQESSQSTFLLMARGGGQGGGGQGGGGQGGGGQGQGGGQGTGGGGPSGGGAGSGGHGPGDGTGTGTGPGDGSGPNGENC